MKKTVTVEVNAKINLSLLVTGRKDGYHMLDTVVASVDLADVVSACKADKNEIVFSAPNIVAEKSNAYKALSYMSEKYFLPPVSIKVGNRIPCGAGLGGSSADCAGVILAVNKLFSLQLSVGEMREIAGKFGSDTAYMITGGFARLAGRGDEIDFFESEFCPEVLIAYKGEVSTKECFLLFDKIKPTAEFQGNDRLIRLLESDCPEKACESLFNHLTVPAEKLNGNIMRIFDIVKGRNAVMTGSGAGVVVFSPDEQTENELLSGGINVIKTRILPSQHFSNR